VLAVNEIAARLDDRFRLLTGGSRTALPRQQTLRALIDWSYGLLGDLERVLFHRLAVFAGGWSLEAAEAVCAGDGIDEYEVLDVLQQLVNKSLVLVDEQGDAARYRYQETIREYARERLMEAGELETMRERHRDWYVQLAEETESQLRGAEGASLLRRLEAEHDNLRAALEWCANDPTGAEPGLRLAGALGRFWLLNDFWSEGRGWLTTALAHPDADNYPAARAHALHSLGSMTTDSMRASAYLEQSLALWRSLGHRPGIAAALDALADEARIQGKLDEARALGEEALSLMRALREKFGIASALFQLACTALVQGHLSEARVLLDESLALRRQIGDKLGVANCLYQMGRTTLADGDYVAARALFEESLTINTEMGNTDTTAWLLNSLGEVARYTGDYTQAAIFYEQSLTLHRELGNTYGVTVALHNLGSVAQQAGNGLEATRLFRESLRLALQTGRRAAVAWCLIGLGSVAGPQRPERAARLFAAAESLLTTIGTRLDPADQPQYERNRAAAQAALAPAAWDAAWAAGAALTTDAAVALAMAE
jgi:tetratricopeptide (TPR) repeat protein